MEYRASESVLWTFAGDAPALCVLPFSNTAQNIPVAANENMPVKSEWMTPAEALQIVMRIKDKMRTENSETYSLFYSASRRKTWDEIVACERCLRWMYFRCN